MASRNWIETIFGSRRHSPAARPRRERADWYVPLEIGRLEERRVLNVAPVLAGANNLATIHQNETNNTGTAVTALISGKVTDTDPGALFGIAVTAIDNTHGTWQYSTNGGTNWLNFGSPANNNALLLAADANTFVRFIPNPDFNGTVSNGITFRAWDQTTGTAGSTASTSSNGGTTAFSNTTASSSITVDQPITITGTGTTSINDQQTATPFSGVTIGDSISSAENITVTLTQNVTANGALSNLGGFVDNHDGTFTFTGNAAAATTALQGLLFTPTAHQVAPGSSLDTTFTILAADSVTSTTDANTDVHVTATNTAPTLGGANNLTTIHENAFTNSGDLVSALIAGQVTDPDFGQTEGIAVTAVDNSNGTWQFSTNGGTSWNAIGAVSNGSALLLAGNANTRVRFSPNMDVSGPITNGITFRAWDGSTGTAGNKVATGGANNGGSTAFSTNTKSASVLINDAPTLSGANNLTTINENDVTNGGTLVSTIISGKVIDINGNSIGIAVTAVDNSNGAWQYSTDGGSNWIAFGSPTTTTAVLLTSDANTLVRFVPNSNFFGTSSITFQAWDETTGTVGGPADASVKGGTTAFSTASATASIIVNAPPTITGTVAGQTTTDATNIDPFSGVTIGDPDVPTQTLTVTVQIGTPANGSFTAASLTGWTTITAGSTYSITGTATVVSTAIDGLVFKPTQHQVAPGNSVTTGFTITANDGIAPAVTDTTTTVIATAGNSAPVLSGANNLTAVQENPATNNGDLVSALISGHVTDSDMGQTEGIAVTAVDNTNGTWQFTTDGGTTWLAIGPVSNTSALLLAGDANTRVRFVPNSNFSGPVSNGLTFRAWDGSSGTAGTKVDASTNGGSTPFSTATASSSILVNDAPVLTGANNLTTIIENPSTNAGDLVSALIAGDATDVNGNSLGIAITAVDNTHGTWQYSTTGGASWTNIGPVSGSSALLLTSDANTRVRFVPAANFFGTVSNGLTFQAWDQTSGTVGTKVDATVNGGTTAFSTASASSSIVVDAPPTITGAVAKSINDNQTTTPFSGVTIGDPDTANVTVTITQSATANGTLSNLGGFTDNHDGTFTFTGTLAAATTAIDAIVFTPTLHQVKPGNSIGTTFTIAVFDGLTTTTNATSVVTVTATNAAPTIAGANDLTAIVENPASNNGTLVSALIASEITDPDFGQTEGIAVTAVVNTNGAWQYSINGGTTWNNFGSPSDTASRLLAGDANTRVRFVPNNNFSGLVSNGITFRAWDGFTGTNGNTANTNGVNNGGSTAFSTGKASSSILVNNAPTLTGANNLTAIAENDSNSNGTLVSDLISGQAADVNGNSVGIAVTAVDDTNGDWQYSTDGGSNWIDFGSPTATTAVLLTPNASTRVRFVPNANFFGTVSAGITFQAWDQTSGTVGVPADATVNGGTTAFSTASASSAIVVEAPPTIAGTTTTTITDAQTTNPFATTTISDPNSPVLTFTVTFTESPANHGTLTNLGGFTSSGGGVFTFTGTAAAATTALEGIVFTPKQHQVKPGQVVVTTFALQVSDGIVSASDNNTEVDVTAANTAPTLAGANNLTAIGENPASNNGDLVSALIAGQVTDPDAGQTEGIAVTAVDDTNGMWQFSSDGGSTWNAIVGVDDAHALLLPGDANTRVRFVPNANFSGPVTNGITFRAWDGFTGMPGQLVDTASNGGETAFSTAKASASILVNDAPVLTGANDLTTIVENPPTNTGTLVSALIAGHASDVNGNPIGIAVTAVDNTNGDWQYSTDGGLNWTDFGTPTASNARLLAADANTFVRFVPNSNFFGLVSPGITFQAWDMTSGTVGGTADATVNGGTTAFSTGSFSSAIRVNAPPTITGTVAGQTVGDNATIHPFANVTIGDPNSPAETLTVTVVIGTTANGQFDPASLTGWTELVPGSGIFQFTGTAAASTTAIQALVFVPTIHQVVVGNTVTTGFTIAVTNSINPTVSDTTTTVIATAVNDAPVIDGTQVQPLTTITEDDVSNGGNTVASLLGSAISDVDFGAVQGIAITGTTVSGHGNGRWQFSIDGGATWNDIGVVSDNAALLLRPTDLVRFLPDAANGNTATLTYRAWDQTGATVGQQGTKVVIAASGTTTPFSTATATSAITATDVNDAPVLDPTQVGQFTTITEDDTANPGQTVASLLNTADSDVDFGAIQGIAITATTVSGHGNGVWQYSTDGGTTWNDVGAVTVNSALLLRSTDLVRFLPDAANGNTATITFQAWDQTGATTGEQGTKIDVSTNGGTTPFSTAPATSAITATDVNDAPVLDPAQVEAGFPTITEKDTTNPGQTVAELLNTAVTDVDFGAVQGMAITATSVTGFGNGIWQYSTDGGTTWTAIGTIPNGSALLLKPTDLVRFRPDAANGNTATITYHAWDQTGTIFNAASTGGTSPFSSATATTTIIAQDVNDPPTLGTTPPTFLPVTAAGSTGAGNGTMIGTLPSSDIDKPSSAFAWAITAGNNGAFSIDPTTGAVSIANASLFTYTPTPIVLTITATENQFNATSAPATSAPQTMTIIPWMVTTSATQLNSQFATTLTINLLSADPTQLFTATIHWGGNIADQTVTLTPNTPHDFLQHFFTNPDPQNAAAPIPISVTIQPLGQPSALAAKSSTQSPIPGAGLESIKVAQTNGSGFDEVAVAAVVEAPAQTNSAEANTTQANDAGVASSEATNTDERIVVLRIVSPLGSEGDNIPMHDTELDNLPGLFKKLPDGHYRVYLAEEGRERLVIDVVVRQGRAVDPTDDSGGTRDRPPTGQSEQGPRDPVVTAEPQAVRDAVISERGNLPQSNADELSLPTDRMNPVLPALQRGDPSPALPIPAAELDNPATGAAPTTGAVPAKHHSADAADKNRWGAALAAAGAAIAAGAGRSREERVDQAMQQLDPRSLTKAGRLARWLRKSK